MAAFLAALGKVAGRAAQKVGSKAAQIGEQKLAQGKRPSGSSGSPGPDPSSLAGTVPTGESVDTQARRKRANGKNRG